MEGPVAHRPVAAARPPAPEHHRQLHRRRRRPGALATVRIDGATSTTLSGRAGRRAPRGDLVPACPRSSPGPRAGRAHGVRQERAGPRRRPRRWAGEIVVADPFQRYRGLEIAADSPRGRRVGARCRTTPSGDLALTEASTAAAFAAVAHRGHRRRARGRAGAGGDRRHRPLPARRARRPALPRPRATRCCATGPSAWPRTTPRPRSPSCAARDPERPRTGSTPPTRAGVARALEVAAGGRRRGGATTSGPRPTAVRRCVVGRDPPPRGARPPASPTGCGGSSTRASSRSWSAALDTPGVLARGRSR